MIEASDLSDTNKAAALAALAPLGIDAQVLADTAARMAEAADALARAAHDLAGAANLRVDAAGDVRLDRAVLAQVYPQAEIRCALIWTEGPRLMPLANPLLDPLYKAP